MGAFDGKDVIRVEAKLVGDKKQLFFQGAKFDELNDEEKTQLTNLYDVAKEEQPEEAAEGVKESELIEV